MSRNDAVDVIGMQNAESLKVIARQMRVKNMYLLGKELHDSYEWDDTRYMEHLKKLVEMV